MSWAIEVIAVCTVAIGCFWGERDENGAAEWILAETKAQCEAQNEAYTRKVIKDHGDEIVSIAVRCSQVGT